MRIALRVVAVLLLGAGVTWILQGIGVLPGSFMTGQMQWAYRGAGCVVAGAALLWLGLRPRSRG